jgi:hypothetical protein
LLAGGALEEHVHGSMTIGPSVRMTQP